MATLEQIQKMADIDLKIDKSGLHNISTEAPYLHNKYYKILSHERLKLKKLQAEYDKLYRDKYKYYSTEFDILLKPTEIPIYIKAEQSIINNKYTIGLVEEKIKYLEAIISNINSLSFNIRNAIEFLKFTNGG